MATLPSTWQYADEGSETLAGKSGYSLRERAFYGVSMHYHTQEVYGMPARATSADTHILHRRIGPVVVGAL
jgi:hypothetical protein